jgi:hypothetical protein
MSYSDGKRSHSAATKKLLAENNAQYYDLQKQRVKELGKMIPQAFLEEAKDFEGSNRELIHTINAAKLFMTSLTQKKSQLQGQLEEGQKHLEDVSIREKEYEVTASL